MSRKITMFLVVITTLIGFQVQANFSNWMGERKYICMLAAYTLVANGLQHSPYSGDYIGCVLLNGNSPESRLAGKGLDSVSKFKDGTRHAVVMCIESYIKECNSKRPDLIGRIATPPMDNMCLFTTLDPCIQCSGMGIMQRIPYLVYGMDDPDSGRTIDRLPPLSTNVETIMEKSQDAFSTKLNTMYTQWKEINPHGSVRDFLKTNGARDVFIEAKNRLMNIRVEFRSENQSFFSHAVYFIMHE